MTSPAVGRTVLDAIGNTPLLEIDGVWVKLEYLNPSGSIKARMARYIIERAEREGLLHPGDTIVEASSGNTGNAMSMVAAVKGYQMIVVTPGGLSPERSAISTAFGAQLVTVGDFHVNRALEVARELGERPGHFRPRQFESEWNVQENRTWLGPEILSQLPDGRLPDAFVMGVGRAARSSGSAKLFVTPIPTSRSWASNRVSHARSSVATPDCTRSRASPTVSCQEFTNVTVTSCRAWSTSTATMPSPRCADSRGSTEC